MSLWVCGLWKNALPDVSSDFDSVYETRSRPHAPRRVSTDAVSPWNHASPIESYCVTLPKRESGRPRFAMPSADASAAVTVGTLILRDMMMPWPRTYAYPACTE